MVSTSAVTAWELPHQWATQSNGWIPGSPPIANAWGDLYAEQAAATVAGETPLWQAWIQQRFPTPAEPGKSE